MEKEEKYPCSKEKLGSKYISLVFLLSAAMPHTAAAKLSGFSRLLKTPGLQQRGTHDLKGHASGVLQYRRLTSHKL